MNKSMWYIFGLGVVGVGCLLMAMCVSLQTFSVMPGQRIRLAENIRARFGFESAAVQAAPEDGKKVLRISYETRQDSKHDILRQRQEMKEVADHAIAQCDAAERREIDEIRISRTEVRGSGCWQDRQVAQESFPNPARTAVETFRFDK